MSDFDRLRELLLGDERAELARHRQRLDEVERARADLPAELPGVIEQANRAQPRQLSRALSEPVADALADTVRARPQMIVDAIFPIIGPAIRRAMAEFLRGFVESMNAAMEASLTPRGLRWRLESWRTGVPYPQVVLKHTLRYRIDHLFLIEHGTGLVIHRESAPELPDLDSDAIAGMLTAIGDFVRDSVRSETGTLGAATVGENLLWVIDGPRANLACFIRGVPSPALRAVLQERLERVHARFADPMASLRAGSADLGLALAEELGIAGVDAQARAADDVPDPRAKTSRAPLILLVLVALGVLSWWWYRDFVWNARMDAVRARLAHWPGLHVDRVRSDPHDWVAVDALIDPLADSPEPWIRELLPPEVALRWNARGYIASDDAIVERRARKVLAPREAVTMNVTEGVLRLVGRATDAELARLRDRATTVPGVQRVDASAVVIDRGPELQALHDAADAAARVEITFDKPGEDASASATPDEVARTVDALWLQASALGRGLEVRAFGLTDESGSATTNAALRERRARWLADALRARLPLREGLSIGTLSLDADDPRALPRRRAVGIEIQIREPGTP